MDTQIVLRVNSMTYWELRPWWEYNPDFVDPSYSECERCLCGGWVGMMLNGEGWLCGLVRLVAVKESNECLNTSLSK